MSNPILWGLVQGLKPQLIASGETITNANTLVGLSPTDGKVYNINTGELTSETPSVFEAGGSPYMAVCEIDTDKYIACYTDSGNSNRGTAIVLTISGDTVSSGTAVVFETGATIKIDVCKIDTNKACVYYIDDASGYAGTACVLSVSGTTITAGTPTVGISGFATTATICALDTDKALVVSRTSSNSQYQTGNVLTISGTTITPATATTINTFSTFFDQLQQVDTDKAILNYPDPDNSEYGTAEIITVSGTTITTNTATVYESNDTGLLTRFKPVKINTDKFVLPYARNVANGDRAVVCTISGTTITAGTAVTPKSYKSTIGVACCKLDDDEFMFFNSDGFAVYCTVSGTTVTVESEIEYDSGTNVTEFVNAVAPTTKKMISIYSDSSNTDKGTSCVVKIGEVISVDGIAMTPSTTDSDTVDKVIYLPF